MKKLKAIIAKWYIESTKKPESHKALELIGVDSEGRKYYTWKDLESVPKSRVAQLQNFALFDEMKLTARNLHAILDAIEQENEAALTDKKNHVRHRSRIAALCEEIRFRVQQLTPIDILLNLSATLAVREDENPDEFNTVIHDEKVSQFKIEEKRGNFFFLTQNLFQKLKPSLVMSEEEWTKHFQKLIFQDHRNESRLKVISAEKSSEEEKKATTS